MIAAPHDNVLPNADADWLPVYSKVNGELPLEDCPQSEVVFARGFFNVQVAGKARLETSDATGLTLWVDGTRVQSPEALLNLEQGRRTLTFAFNPKQRQHGLRIQLKAVDDSLKFQPEGGL